MWATLAIAATLSLAPGQAGDLRLSNVRTTYGYLGPVRTDNKFLPGDVIFLMFDIDGLKINEIGEAYYRMGMTLKDSKGKEHFKQELLEQKQLQSLGGSKVLSFAHAIIGADQPAGQYVFEVTVQDPATKKEVSHQHKFQIEEKRLGIVRFGLFYDANASLPAPALAVPGQTVLVSFGVVGFQRDTKNKQPDIAAEMQVFDDKGTKINKPIGGDAKELPEKFQGIPMQFVLSLNRPGKYKVQVTVTDRNANKKTTEQTFEVTVVEQK